MGFSIVALLTDPRTFVPIAVCSACHLPLGVTKPSTFWVSQGATPSEQGSVTTINERSYAIVEIHRTRETCLRTVERFQVVLLPGQPSGVTEKNHNQGGNGATPSLLSEFEHGTYQRPYRSRGLPISKRNQTRIIK